MKSEITKESKNLRQKERLISMSKWGWLKVTAVDEKQFQKWMEQCETDYISNREDL